MRHSAVKDANDFATLKTVYLYTDASFNETYGIGVIGSLLCEAENHDSFEPSKAQVQLLRTHEKNNIRLELRGALLALQRCPESRSAVLYSDCQTLCNLPQRRKKLESENYRTRANRRLANADLYQEFFSAYDRIEPQIIWIKGHHSGQKITRSQKIFSFLDKEVRRELRRLLKLVG